MNGIFKIVFLVTLLKKYNLKKVKKFQDGYLSTLAGKPDVGRPNEVYIRAYICMVYLQKLRKLYLKWDR